MTLKVLFQAKESVAVSKDDFEGPMKEIADVTTRLQHGATVEEVNAAYESHEFPKLERKTSQMAMLRVVERVGETAAVQQVLTQECAEVTSDHSKSLDSVGFKALLSTLSNVSHKTEEVITSFQPDDFSEKASEEQFAKLVHVSPEMNVAQVKSICMCNVEKVSFKRSFCGTITSCKTLLVS